MKITSQFISILESRPKIDFREDFVINHDTTLEIEHLNAQEPSPFLGIMARTHVFDHKLRIVGTPETYENMTGKCQRAYDLMRSTPKSCVGVLVFQDYFCFLYRDGKIAMNTGQTMTADSE